MTLWAQAFVAGWLGGALWDLGGMLWHRRRHVIVTREMIVKHPDVKLVDRRPTNSWATVGSGRTDEGTLSIKPMPTQRLRKPSRRERALRVLAGGKEGPSRTISSPAT